ncbi:nuclear pore complex protein Nup85-like [Dysidea avara]|uniref:nuclear pore complex protein Nup85-like n=1 Tax=Dysidea avara TaxID=196820 RepID=UPI00331C53F2
MDDRTPELQVPLKEQLNTQLTIGRSWAPSSIVVYIGPHGRPQDGKSPFGNKLPQSVCEVSVLSQQWSEVERQLANEGYGIFCELQKAHELQQAGKGDITVEQLLTTSRHYRAIIHVCVMELQRERAENHEVSSYEPQTDQTEMFVLMEMIWHLCEVVFLASLPAGYFVGELVEWVCWHSNHADELLKSVSEYHPTENHPDYWTLVYTLVLEGRFTEARELLKNNSNYEYDTRNGFTSMDELLRCVPLNKDGLSQQELQQYWQVWWNEVTQRRNHGDFIRYPQLQLLSQLMTGDDDKAFQTLMERYPSSCPCWYHMMVGKLLFCYPTIISSDYELLQVAESCLTMYNTSTHTQFDATLLTVLKGNVIELLSSISSAVNNWWFAAHLTHLMFHAGLLQESHHQYGSGLQEFLMLEYGSSLMTHDSLWQLGVHYLSTCPKEGKGYLSLLLERVPLTSKSKALKVLSICHKYDLPSQALSVCKVMASQECGNGRLASALYWCTQSKDASLASSIVERYMDDYITSGELRDFDWFSSMDASMLMNNKMAFLCKYSEFHKLYASGDLQAAANLLSLLLEKRLVPKQFWLTLLTDALPLLEHPDKVVFSKEQTFEMMKCMQAVEDMNSEKDDRKELIYVALGRNLCRAVIET